MDEDVRPADRGMKLEGPTGEVGVEDPVGVGLPAGKGVGVGGLPDPLPVL